jgi:hypothetical protein
VADFKVEHLVTLLTADSATTTNIKKQDFSLVREK